MVGYATVGTTNIAITVPSHIQKIKYLNLLKLFKLHSSFSDLAGPICPIKSDSFAKENLPRLSPLEREILSSPKKRRLSFLSFKQGRFEGLKKFSTGGRVPDLFFVGIDPISPCSVRASGV
nr:hypothetical protein [uncultured Pseudodesulfovibrio sp.]